MVNWCTKKVFIKIIKRWSEAESFTIFENYVYPSKKILGLPKFFAFFGAKIGALSISLTTEEFCPNYLPFLEPKLEHLLQRNFALIFCLFWSQNRSTYYRGILPKFFAFLEPKSEHLLQRNVTQIFCPSWSQNWSTFYCWLSPILPKFFAFFGVKTRAPSTANYPLFCPIFLPFWSQKWSTFYLLLLFWKKSIASLNRLTQDVQCARC